MIITRRVGGAVHAVPKVTFLHILGRRSVHPSCVLHNFERKRPEKTCFTASHGGGTASRVRGGKPGFRPAYSRRAAPRPATAMPRPLRTRSAPLAGTEVPEGEAVVTVTVPLDAVAPDELDETEVEVEVELEDP